MTMELSHQALDGLQIAGDSAHIPDNLFKQLLPIACNVLVNQSRSETLPGRNELLKLVIEYAGSFYYRPYKH